MFTGIIKDLGEVKHIKRGSMVMEMGIKTSLKLKEGDSVAVNGVCLTVKKVQRDEYFFDISGETIKRTNIDTLKVGNRVNLEPALKPDDMLSGHIVQGHIDGTGTIYNIRKKGENIEVDVLLPSEIMSYIIEKGSIAIDGISLTVASIRRNVITIAVIPYTWENTNLKFRKKGDKVNIEIDVIGKYVKKFMEVR